MHAMEQELLQQRAANASLQAQVSATPAEGARQTPAIDTRGLGKPDVFGWDSIEIARREIRGAVPHRSVTVAEETDEPIFNAVLTRPGAREASEQLALILVMIFRAAALEQVFNAGPGEGLTAWRSLCRLSEPRARTQVGGVLLGLLNFDFSGSFGSCGGLWAKNWHHMSKRQRNKWATESESELCCGEHTAPGQVGEKEAADRERECAANGHRRVWKCQVEGQMKGHQ